MRVLMVSIGSWGDAEPFVALAKELCRNKQHSVDLFLQPQYDHRIPAALKSGKDASLQVHSLPFDSEDFYEVVPSQPRKDVDPKLKYVEIVGEIIGQLVLPCLDQVHAVAQECQVLISCAFARSLCIMLAKALDLPMILVHLQPLAPNRIYPSYRTSKRQFVASVASFLQTGKQSAGSEDFEETYWKIDKPLEEIFLKDRMALAYQKLGICPVAWPELELILKGYDSQFLIVNAYSNHLVPPISNTPGVGQHVYDVGPLSDAYLPPYYEPEPALIKFLQECDSPPICIGFGSMPFHRVPVIVDALLQLGRKAIFVGKSLAISSCPSEYQRFVEDMIFQVSFVPYACLLPHCSLMLCHGGAGVVHACLRAGIPCLVSPIMGDQFMFASLLQHKRLGLQCGTKLSGLTVAQVVQAIQTVEHNGEIMDNCKLLGEQILEAESSCNVGVKALINLIEELANTRNPENLNSKKT